MDDDNFDVNELFKQIFSQMEKISNIDEALQAHSVEEAMIKDSFNNVWNNYNLVSDNRKKALKALFILRLQLFFSFFIRSIINNDIGLEVDSLIDKIKASSLKIKNQKELLILIKKALKKLESKLIYDCNYDINELLELLYIEDFIIIKIVSEEINRFETRMNRIAIYPSQRYNDDLNKIEEQIDEYAKSLGLK